MNIEATKQRLGEDIYKLSEKCISKILWEIQGLGTKSRYSNTINS